MKLSVGMQAPDFKAEDQDGNIHQLSDYAGQKLAIYFYPKDNTPGCTAQACNIRDNYEELLKAGIKILGVSVQDAKSHKKFQEKYNLPFPLLIDTDHKMVEDYGVWGDKKFMGKSYKGTIRTTFLIDDMGKIKYIIDRVKTKDHAKQILTIWK